MDIKLLKLVTGEEVLLADHYVQSTSSIDMSAATPQGVIAQ